MQKKYRSQLTISSIIVVILFLLLFLFSFFIFRKNNERNIKSHYYTSNVLRLKDLLPVSDSLGKKFTGHGTAEGVQGYVEFSISNISNRMASYEIYLTEHNSSDESFQKIRGNYVKFYLTNEIDVPMKGFDKNVLPTYNDLGVLKDLPSGKLLYHGEIRGKTTEKYRLRVWLSDSYSIISTEKGKKFIVDVRIREV